MTAPNFVNFELAPGCSGFANWIT